MEYKYVVTVKDGGLVQKGKQVWCCKEWGMITEADYRLHNDCLMFLEQTLVAEWENDKQKNL